MSAISVHNLTKRYADLTAIDSVSFEIDKGEIVGFLGPNGAGKTTTMKILTCFMPATSGTARVAGHDCYEEPLFVKRKIGYLPENAPLYSEMNVFEYLEYIASMHGITASDINGKIKNVINSCGLETRIFSEIAELSKGYKQRVGLASALIHDPDILILDEPTSGLDPNQRIEIRDLIKHIGKKKTIMLSSHILPEIEATCNRVIIINNGKIVASGTPSQLESEAASRNRLNIIVAGDPSDAEKLLKKINDISKIKNKGKVTENEYAFEITEGKDKDLRKDIISMFNKSRITSLLEISRKEVSLEDVFTFLTK